MLHPPKRLVYAYDELQSLDDSSMPGPEDVFGNNPDGTPKVTLGVNQDFILERCYRNSGPVLTMAHALGFGVYRKKKLVQIFDDKDLWKEIGYENLSDGEITDGRECILARSSDSSPKFLEMDETPESLIESKVFNDASEQDEWLVNQIKANRTSDELLPNDILVINPDPFTTKSNTGRVRSMLFGEGMRTILAGVDASAETFFDGESIMFSGIRRARGNEASMVYIINAHECFDASAYDLARVRNRLFTAISRSKAWVRISGYGPAMKELEYEIQKVREEHYRLRFPYPDAAERAKMRRLNKDRPNAKRRLVKAIEKAIKLGQLDWDDLESFRHAQSDTL
jgi:superfamily I DNA and RNA helicase